MFESGYMDASIENKGRESVVRAHPPAEHTLDFLVGTGVVVGRKPLVGGDLKEG